MSLVPESQPAYKPEALLRVPVGFASPLWGLFAGAAVSGAAWWWMTRWTRPQNLEAMFAVAETVETAVEPALAVLEAPVTEAVKAVETMEPVVEAAIETAPLPPVEPAAEVMTDIAAKATVEPALDIAAEAVEAVEPAVVEPIVTAAAVTDAAVSVGVEAAAAPKTKKKAALPKSD